MVAPGADARTRASGGPIGRRAAIVLSLVVLIVIGAVAGYAVYRERVAPFQATVLRVDDDTVSMDYLLDRAALTDRTPLEMLEALVRERIVLASAPLPPFGINVSDDDVEARLREVARGDGDPLSDAEYAEWFRQQVNESGLSGEEVREVVRADLTSARLEDELRARVPSVAEQVRILMVTGPSRDAVRKFVALAGDGDPRDVVADSATLRDLGLAGGELGWLPREALSPAIAAFAFSDTEGAEPSGPIPLPNGRFAVVTVVERAQARAVEGEALQAIRDRAFEAWFAEERSRHRIVYGDPEKGWTSATDAWARARLDGMRADRGS